MTQKPKISIIMCCLNHEAFIEESLRSVVEQDYDNVEFIIMDGGSTDRTVEIIKRFGESITYWVSEKDDGQVDAINKGFAKATGDIYGWLCSDDLLEPGALSEVAAFFSHHPQAEVVYGDCSYMDRRGTLTQIKRLPAFHRWLWLWDGYIPQPSCFWKGELFHRVGRVNPDFLVAFDKDLWDRFSHATRIWHVSRLWSRMRIYQEAKHNRMHAQGVLEEHQIRERTLGSFRAKFACGAQEFLARNFRRAIEASLGTKKWVMGHREKGRPCDEPGGLAAGYFDNRSSSKDLAMGSSQS